MLSAPSISAAVTSLRQLVLFLAIAFALTAVVAGALRMLVLWIWDSARLRHRRDSSCKDYIGALCTSLSSPHHAYLAANLISRDAGKVTDTIVIDNQLLTLLNSLVLLPLIAIAAILSYSMRGWLDWRPWVSAADIWSSPG